MYHPNRILERELEFTKIYRENIGQPKAVRESRCMDAQMATYFVTMQPHDLIANLTFKTLFILGGGGQYKITISRQSASCSA